MAQQDGNKRGKLKKVVRRKKVHIGTGDGGLMSHRDKEIITNQPKDTTFIIKDSIVVLPPWVKNKK